MDRSKDEPKFEIGKWGGQVIAVFKDGGKIDGKEEVTDLLLLAILRRLDSIASHTDNSG